jgi:HSP20 family protein
MPYDIFDPFEEMKRFRKQMNKMFEDFWTRRLVPKKMAEIRQPAVDIVDKKGEIEVTAELPGVDKKDVAVNVQEDRIEIRAQQKAEKEVKKKDYYQHERSYCAFYRAFALPALVDPNKAKTSFSNGVLKINLPKLKQIQKKSKTIYLK